MSIALDRGPFRNNDPGAAAPNRLDNRLQISAARNTAEERARNSLASVLNLLHNDDEYDEAMTILGLHEDRFVEPLNRHEVMVLASALYNERTSDKPLIYLDVLEVTRKFNGKAMNLTMVYRTIERLIVRGMLDEVSGDVAGRSRAYCINMHGRNAFRIAVLNAELLRNPPDSKAA